MGTAAISILGMPSRVKVPSLTNGGSGTSWIFIRQVPTTPLSSTQTAVFVLPIRIHSPSLPPNQSRCRERGHTDGGTKEAIQAHVEVDQQVCVLGLAARAGGAGLGPVGKRHLQASPLAHLLFFIEAVGVRRRGGRCVMVVFVLLVQPSHRQHSERGDALADVDDLDLGDDLKGWAKREARESEVSAATGVGL